MPKKNSIFGSLYLDRDQIEPDINEFCGRKFASFSMPGLVVVNAGNGLNRCTIIGDNKEITVDFYFRADGTTTIQPAVGANQDVSFELAHYILQKAPYADVKGVDYSVKIGEEFDTLLEYLEALEGVQQTYTDLTGQNGYKLYQYRSKFGDRITLKYFANKTLQIQGKPMYLHQEVSCFLSQFFPFDDVVKKQGEVFSVPLDPVEVRDEIMRVLPTAHNILDEQLLKILTASLAFKKIDITLPDYSSFAWPALRTLEGYLRYLFTSKGIAQGSQLGGCFNLDSAGNYRLPSSVKSQVGCPKTCDAMENVYNYYNAHRHGLAHTADIAAASRIITNKREAHTIIDDVINLIESSHVYINTP